MVIAFYTHPHNATTSRLQTKTIFLRFIEERYIQYPEIRLSQTKLNLSQTKQFFFHIFTPRLSELIDNVHAPGSMDENAWLSSL